MHEGKDFEVINSDVTRSLLDLASVVNLSKESIFLGSVALHVHTLSHGYFRKIKDVDVIVNKSCQSQVESDLNDLGYQRSTFINDNMPLHKLLRRFGWNRYARFYKDGAADLEILFARIKRDANAVEVSIFPGLTAVLPTSELQEVSLLGVTFTTVSAKQLLQIKVFAKNLLNRFYPKNDKTVRDIKALENVVEGNEFNERRGGLRFKYLIFGLPLRRSMFVES
ncbi:hypothetical protein KC614_00660 [candidate division WWE3 bacterium]|uniref:Uncharacterized protein n=1 Tax=candidate division WWE3 bacterium TaxID=2053526 RepID=A0A955LJD3_UNCKA|nr:hypothetical protein [candidate division WWE3 bacterium]